MNFLYICKESIKRFFLNSGELTAHCVGPHKIAYCELYDQMDGTFTLFIKPQEGGKHMLTIKYGGEHVSGIENIKLILNITTGILILIID